MKKTNYLLIVIAYILLFLTTKVSAESMNYSIVIDSNNNLNVYSGGTTSGTPVTDYPEFFSYENNVLTLMENAEVVFIKSSKDITITSNDKLVNIYKVEPGSNSSDVHYIFKNINNTSTSFNMIGERMSAEVIDSHFKVAYFNLSDWNIRENDKERLIIKNSSIEETGVVVSYAHTYIEDSTLNISRIEERGNNLTIINSKIKTQAEVANYSINNEEVTKTIIKDSDLEYISSECQNSNNCLLGNGNGPTHPGILHIENSKIKNYNIINMRSTSNGNKSSTKIINTDFENIRLLETFNPTFINNCDISIGRLNNTTNESDNDQNGVSIKDSKINVGEFNAMGNVDIDNSYVEADTLDLKTYPINTEIYIRDSYVRLINNNNKPTFINANLLSIHNSNFYAENNSEYVYLVNRTSSNYNGASIEIDDYLKLIDKNDVEVHLVGKGSLDPNINKYQAYLLAYDGDETYPNSLKLISKAKVTFKIINGTWEDGTSDDVIISKDVWTKLEENDIPKNMIGNLNGHWEVAPNTSDYIKKDVIYTYVFDKEDVNESSEEEKIKNPETGAFISEIVFIAFIISGIALFIYSKKKSKFTKI